MTDMRFSEDAYLDRAYGTDAGLSVRVETHRRYGILRHDIFDLLTEYAAKRHAPARVLDVGAGTGTWYRAIRRNLGEEVEYVGLDRSQGMCERLQAETADDPRAEVIEGDAQRLPFGRPAFDWVGLHFMLYHVPDICRALDEALRVLRPGGLLIAATTGPRPYRELLEIERHAIAACGHPAAEAPWPSDRFDLGSGATWFPEPPEVVRYRAGFRFDAAEPAVAYLASGPVDAAIAHAGAPGNIRPAVLAQVFERVGEIIGRDGLFEVHAESGFFLLQKSF